ncbi:unnamed protein product [Heterosigma akashiwo]
MEGINWEEKLTAFYEKHQPDKVGDISGLLAKYNGKEHQLWAALQKKYGVTEEEPAEQEGEDEEGSDDEEEAAGDAEGGEQDEEKQEEEQAAIQYPVQILYCGVCGLPPEYCENGPSYELCLPWIEANCPELLAAKAEEEAEDGEEGEEEGKKKKTKRGGKGPKKKAGPTGPGKCVISLSTRNRRKYITTITGLDSFPGVKLKVAAKACGRKFASGAAVNTTPSGEKEIVIQGDVVYDVPNLLEGEFQIPSECIFILENGKEVSIV